MMGGVLHVVKFEWRRLVRDRRVMLLAAALTVLSSAAFAIGWRDAVRNAEVNRRLQELDHVIWQEQGAKNPHTATHFGRVVVKPVSVLTAFDAGLDPFYGTAFFVEGHRRNFPIARPAEDQTMLLYFGHWTPAFILQMVGPMLAILVVFGAFSGERTSGRLDLLSALGAQPVHLLLGKGVAASALLLGGLLPLALVAAACVFATGHADVLPAAACLGLVHMVYFLIFVCLGLFVSAVTRTPSQSLLVLLMFWAATSLFVPRAAAGAAEALFPTPSPGQFYADIEDRLARFTPRSLYQQRLREVEARVLAEHGVDSTDELPFNWAGVAIQVMDEVETEEFNEQFRRLWETYDHHQAIYAGAGAISPLLSLRELSALLSGTSSRHQRDLAEAVEGYRQRYVQFLNDHMRDHAGDLDYAYKADAALWHETPVFEYEGPSHMALLRAAVLPAAFLAAWAGVSGALALWGARRALRSGQRRNRVRDMDGPGEGGLSF